MAAAEWTKQPVTRLTVTNTPPTMLIKELRKIRKLSRASTWCTARGVKSYDTARPGRKRLPWLANVSGWIMCSVTDSWYWLRVVRKPWYWVGITLTCTSETPIPPASFRTTWTSFCSGFFINANGSPKFMWWMKWLGIGKGDIELGNFNSSLHHIRNAALTLCWTCWPLSLDSLH